MRDRVDAFGVAEPELLLAGGNQIEVNLPGVDNAERAAQQVGSTAQLFFYDWEANILDESCKANPDENASQKSPITGFYKAVKQASKCPAQTDNNNNAGDAPRFYAFDKTSKQPLNNGQPSDSKQAALEGLTPAQRKNAEVLEVPTGILVIRDEKPSPKAPDPDRWWVIQDNPALSGTDIKNPKQSFDQQAGNQPIVTFDFTKKGRTAFHNITREIAAWGENPEERFSREELGDILDSAIDSLEPLYRSVFVLRDIEELSTEDTAEALDLSVPAVKSRLLRARLQLRERLTRYFKRKGDDAFAYL